MLVWLYKFLFWARIFWKRLPSKYIKPLVNGGYGIRFPGLDKEFVGFVVRMPDGSYIFNEVWAYWEIDDMAFLCLPVSKNRAYYLRVINGKLYYRVFFPFERSE